MITLLPALLTLHLIGFAIMAATTLVEFINYKFFWRTLKEQNQQAAGILAAVKNPSKLVGIGAMLQILTGVGMIASTHGAYAAQIWLKFKMLLVLLLILNGAFNGNKTVAKIRRSAEMHEFRPSAQLNILRSRLNIFYIIQLVIFLLIVILSAFKFN